MCKTMLLVSGGIYEWIQTLRLKAAEMVSWKTKQKAEPHASLALVTQWNIISSDFFFPNNSTPTIQSRVRIIAFLFQFAVPENVEPNVVLEYNRSREQVLNTVFMLYYLLKLSH